MLQAYDWKAEHQTMVVFLRRDRSVPGHAEYQCCLFRLFSLVPVTLMLTTVCILNSKCFFFSFLFHFPLNFSSLAAAVIVHCVWGWTRANPWSRNGRKHLSGIIPFPLLPSHRHEWTHRRGWAPRGSFLIPSLYLALPVILGLLKYLCVNWLLVPCRLPVVFMLDHWHVYWPTG